VLPGEPLRIDWRPAVVRIVEDVGAGVDSAVVAARFHAGVAKAIVEVCAQLRSRKGITTVGLTGGVFQNVLLVKLAVEALRAAAFDVLVHQRVPPNDGGLALGQAIVARLSGESIRRVGPAASGSRRDEVIHGDVFAVDSVEGKPFSP
jgi:hydrogenase maturation protein HypF